MKVFRLCYKNEIDKILNDKTFDNVGSSMKFNKNNDYSYDENKKYLHFFGNKNDIFRLNCYESSCICTYDIPSNILYNNSTTASYIEPNTRRYNIDVLEYVIENKKMKYEYLKDIEMLNYELDYEDIDLYKNDKSLVKSLKNKI